MKLQNGVAFFSLKLSNKFTPTDGYYGIKGAPHLLQAGEAVYSIVRRLVYQLYPKFFAQIGPTVASIDLFKYIRLSQLLHFLIVVL